MPRPWFERSVHLSDPKQVRLELPTKSGTMKWEEECVEVRWGRVGMLVSTQYDLEERLPAVQAFARMTPYRLLKPLRMVVLAKHWDSPANGLGCGQLGTMLFSSGSVPRLGNQSGWRMHAWLHELGHLQRSCCGPVGGRAAWSANVEADEGTNGYRWVTPYAAHTESMSEDWAESVALHVLDGWEQRGMIGAGRYSGWRERCPNRAATLTDVIGA